MSAEATAKRPRRSRLRLVLGVVFTLAIAAGLVAAITGQTAKLSDLDLRLRPLWFLLAVPGFFMVQLIHAEVWHLTLRSLGHDLPAMRSRAMWNVSLLGRYAPTGALVIVTRLGMAERQGVPKRVTVAGFAYEIALALGSALAVGAYFIVALPDLEGQPLRYAALVVPVAALVCMHPRVFHPAANWLLRRLRREPLPRSLPLSKVLLFSALYAVSWVSAGLGVLGVLLAVHPLDSSDVPLVIGSYAAAFTLSLIGVVLPGSVGAREAALAVTLAPAVPLAVGLGVAVISRLIQISGELMFAAVTPAVARRHERRHGAASPGPRHA